MSPTQAIPLKFRECIEGLGFIFCDSVYMLAGDAKEIKAYLYPVKVRKNHLFVSCSIGSDEVDAVASRCLRKYGGAIYESMETGPSRKGLLRTSLGRLAGWGETDALSWQHEGLDASSERLVNAIEKFVIPVLRRTTSLTTLYELYASDNEPFPWALTNGAARLAQIVFLASVLGKGFEEVERSVVPYIKYVSSQLDGYSFDEYLNSLRSEIGSISRASRY